MTISDAMRTVRRTKHRTGIYLTSPDGEQVDILRLKPPRGERFLKRCLRDKEFQQSFVGVYDRDTSIVDLRADVRNRVAQNRGEA